MFKTIKLAALAAIVGTAAFAEDADTNIEFAGLTTSGITETQPLPTRATVPATRSQDDEIEVIVEEILSVYVIGKGITLTN